MELTSQTRANLDVSAAAAEVLAYTYQGAIPVEVVARVTLGAGGQPIAGGGAYVLDVAINDVFVSPSSNIDVAAGRTRTILSSRSFPLARGDLVSIVVLGQPGDIAVDATAILRDVTAAKAADLAGDGAVLVDHDYGGADALAVEVEATGARIDNAVIMAFRAADYAAGRRQPAYVVGQTATDVDGRWRAPLLLDPGAYTLLVYKQGVLQAKTVSLTVG